MATESCARGRGIGRELLERCSRHAAAKGGDRLWCNARVGARRFYERAGFAVEGAPFELAGIGRHYLMSRRLHGH
jgi:ribosomal protein S18 acetylase RimI-like enzyme